MTLSGACKTNTVIVLPDSPVLHVKIHRDNKEKVNHPESLVREAEGAH